MYFLDLVEGINLMQSFSNRFSSVAFCLLTILTLCPCVTQASVFSYAAWNNGQPVALTGPAPTESYGRLRGAFFEIEGVPETVTANQVGCYCFPITAPEFIYTHVYFYTSKYLGETNRLLEAFGYPLLKGLKIQILRTPGEQSTGSAAPGLITLRTPNNAIDPTVLAHEIGHELHRHLSGEYLPAFPDMIRDRNWSGVYSWLGVMEGTANFISAILNEDPRVGRHDWYDVSIDLNTFVRFPDLVPTVADNFRAIVSSFYFAQKYPITLALARDQLANPRIPEIMSMPDPYRASAAINQPLWQAVASFGKQPVAKIYFAALHRWIPTHAYSDFAQRILESTQDPELRTFLAHSFAERGLQVQ